MTSTLDRGFKSWAERTAASLRSDLGLGVHDPMLPASLARYMEVLLWTPQDVPGLPSEVLSQLTEIDPSGCVEYRVAHAPWQVWATTNARFERNASTLYGKRLATVLDRRPDCAFVADGSPVIVFKGNRIL